MIRRLAWPLTTLLLPLAAGAAQPAATPDPNLWLEANGNEQVRAWVAAENARTQAALIDTPLYAQLVRAGNEALSGGDTIPAVSLNGNYVYEIARSATALRGQFRRAPVAGWRAGHPIWADIIDFDALAAREGQEAVFQGSNCLAPRFEHCLFRFSRGGCDASESREYVVANRSFVTGPGGFTAPPAKGDTAWIDENEMVAALATGPGDSTTAGYAATARRWRRGTALADASVLLRAAPGDVRLTLTRLVDAQGKGGVFIRQEHDFARRTWWLVRGDRAVRLALPPDAWVSAVQEGELVFSIDSPAALGGAQLRADSVYSVPIAALESGRTPPVRVILEPGPRQTVDAVRAAGDGLLVVLSDSLSDRLLQYRFRDGAWTARRLAMPENLNIQVGSASATTALALVTAEGFLTPRTLFTVDPATGRVASLATAASVFDARGMTVERREAPSRDGTMIPYFVIRRANAPLDGSNPTQLFAYGGFGLSLTPFYLGVTGKLWLERGGIYVQASIRGGGEFGSAWHQAAVGTSRQNAYDDLIAVAEELTARGYTSPRRLGFMGGSNGGLTAGVMYTQRPDLFGAIAAGGPLLDMVRYDQLSAGASWHSEYGDPADPREGAFLRSISPYHNVAPGRPRPPILLTTSATDDRVHPGHARKFANLLRSLGLDYLYFETDAGGHAGASFQEDFARQQALIYTFFSLRLMTPVAH
jgi:prolyl oligopeptidase